MCSDLIPPAALTPGTQSRCCPPPPLQTPHGSILSIPFDLRNSITSPDLTSSPLHFPPHRFHSPPPGATEGSFCRVAIYAINWSKIQGLRQRCRVHSSFGSIPSIAWAPIDFNSPIALSPPPVLHANSPARGLSGLPAHGLSCRGVSISIPPIESQLQPRWFIPLLLFHLRYGSIALHSPRRYSI